MIGCAARSPRPAIGRSAGPPSRDQAPEPRSPAGNRARGRGQQAAPYQERGRESRAGIRPGERRGAGAERASYGECRRARPRLDGPGGRAAVGLGRARGGLGAGCGSRSEGVESGGARARLGWPGGAAAVPSGAAAPSLDLGSWPRPGLEDSGWPIRFGESWCNSSLGRSEVRAGSGDPWHPGWVRYWGRAQFPSGWIQLDLNVAGRRGRSGAEAGLGASGVAEPRAFLRAP